IGTITWDGDPRFLAETIWTQELDAHGAALDPGFTNHEPVGSPDRMTRMLQEAGFESARSWMTPFDHPYGMEELIAIRTTRGHSRRRFESLAPPAREKFLLRARARLSALGPDAFVDRCRIVYPTAVRTDAD